MSCFIIIIINILCLKERINANIKLQKNKQKTGFLMVFLKNITIFLSALLLGIIIQYGLSLTYAEIETIIIKVFLGFPKVVPLKPIIIPNLYEYFPPTPIPEINLSNMSYSQWCIFLTEHLLVRGWLTFYVFKVALAHIANLNLDPDAWARFCLLIGKIHLDAIKEYFENFFVEIDQKNAGIRIINRLEAIRATHRTFGENFDSSFDFLILYLGITEQQQQPLLNQMIDIWVANPSFCLCYGLVLTFFFKFFLLYFRKES